MGIIIVVLLVLGLVALGPILAIWSLNILFGLGIAYGIKTWFAALILSSLVGASVSRGK